MTSEDQSALRRRAEERVKAREDFQIHLIIFVMVNGLLWLIWFINGANVAQPWPIYATIGWGIGLFAHWWTVYGRINRRREEAIQEEMRRMQDGR